MLYMKINVMYVELLLEVPRGNFECCEARCPLSSNTDDWNKAAKLLEVHLLMHKHCSCYGTQLGRFSTSDSLSRR